MRWSERLVRTCFEPKRIQNTHATPHPTHTFTTPINRVKGRDDSIVGMTIDRKSRHSRTHLVEQFLHRFQNGNHAQQDGKNERERLENSDDDIDAGTNRLPSCTEIQTLGTRATRSSRSFNSGTSAAHQSRSFCGVVKVIERSLNRLFINHGFSKKNDNKSISKTRDILKKSKVDFCGLFVRSHATLITFDIPDGAISVGFSAPDTWPRKRSGPFRRSYIR